MIQLGRPESTNATEESACEDDWAEQVSPAKPGAEKHLPSGWADKAIKSSLPPTEIILPMQGQEKSGSPEIDGHTEIGCRLQGYEI